MMISLGGIMNSIDKISNSMSSYVKVFLQVTRYMLLDLTGGVSASHAAAILAKFLPSRGGVVLPYGKSSVEFMCRLSPATLEPCSFPFALRLCVHSELLINVNSGWEPSPRGNDAFLSISDRILNKGQVSLEFKCLCCSWIKVKSKKGKKRRPCQS